MVKNDSISQFRVSNDGAYGGGTDLDHSNGSCDWRRTIDGMTLAEAVALACEHADVCDGMPQPRRSRQSSVMGEHIMKLWASEISRQVPVSPMSDMR